MSDTLVQTVSTGDVVVFNKKTRELILINHLHSLEWDKESDKTFETAEKFATANKGAKFSRNDLQSIQAALAGVVLLV